MSQNFFSRPVLTSSDGISHDNETIVESAEAKRVRELAGDGTAKPLFQQLQKNADEKQEMHDKRHAETFSGTRGLDEEDVGHLDELVRKRREKQLEIKKGVDEELNAFRLARADKALVVSLGVEETTKRSAVNGTKKTEAVPEQKPAAKSKIVVLKKKKKRARADNDTDADADTDTKKKVAKAPAPASESVPVKVPEPNPEPLGSLLGGYGSSSSSDEE